jgi:putative serine protease PepD
MLAPLEGATPMTDSPEDTTPTPENAGEDTTPAEATAAETTPTETPEGSAIPLPAAAVTPTEPSAPEAAADEAAAPAASTPATPVAPPAPVTPPAAFTPPAPLNPPAASTAPTAPVAAKPPVPYTAPAAPAAATPTLGLPTPTPPAAFATAIPTPGAPTPPKAPADPAAKGSAFKRAPVGVIAALAVGALVGGVSGAGVAYWALSSNGSSTIEANSIPANITVNDPDNATTVTAVAASAGASVVTISATGTDASGTGSGVVISKDGYILTNTHVVTLEGATADAKVTVQMSDGRLFDATIVGTDPIVDLAVIKIDGVTDLTPIEFADSSKLNVGDTAIAIGAPLGLNNTVTNGIVSALNRSITIASSAVPEGTEGSESETPDSSENPFDFWQFDTDGGDTSQSTASSTISLSVIQTDAAINPGNSGGALLNSSGELIGINVAIASAGETSSSSGNIGVGFAVPSNLAQRVAEEIIENGTATHGLLGASVLDVTEDSDITDSLTVGASVKEVSDGGAASAAGIKVGDVITGINGLPVTGKTDLTAQIRSLAAGSTATVTYVRSGKTYSTEVTLGAL